MKEIRKVLIILLTLFSLAVSLIWLRVQRTERMRFVKNMGVGINIGNSLDVKGLKKRKLNASTQEYETYWNNPPITAKLFHSIREAGFGTVRIPVSWGEHLDANGQIDPAWMARVVEVVDMAMEEGLYVILDLHHEAWLVPTEEAEEQVTETFCSLWTQIADTFKNYGDSLLFESMNEPRLAESSFEWNGGTEEMREVVNRLNQAFVDIVRASGEENKHRYLILPGYGHNKDQDALNAIRIPKDRRLIAAVHAYLPYSFTQQESGTDKWSEQKESDSSPIEDLMSFLNHTFIEKNIPVIITEFGCMNKNNPTDRQAWAKYYTWQAKKNNISLIWWDQGSTMKLFDRETGECVEPELVEILTSASGS